MDISHDTSIIHIAHDGKQSTALAANAPESSRKVLSDLGYKASDLLQSNAIIWVEGPSDRIFINKWLRLASPSIELLEGIHYSIMFYGGSGLAHLTASAESHEGDFVDLLSINRHCFIIIDRDGDAPGVALAKRKERIQKEIGEELCWVTQGREIENYIPSDKWHLLLKQRKTDISNFIFGSDDRIQQAIDRSSGTRAIIDYSNHKPERARDVADLLTIEDLNILDLRDRIELMVRQIITWNFISPNNTRTTSSV